MDKPIPKSSRRHANALLQGISDFFQNDDTGLESKITDLPKRFTIYEPMLLLPPRFVAHSATWEVVYSKLTQPQRADLFGCIVSAFRRAGHNITHVAINAPIAPTKREFDARDAIDNNMRSPFHLQGVYGDFGPTTLVSCQSQEPTEEDFDAAFWVETSQLTNIKQVWAPRWSMFSRGNVREKARILGYTEQNASPFPGLAEKHLEESIADVDVADMYVGIGYFAISYLKRGIRRVFGWDINPWSIEALRRGCDRNGFECRVVRMADYAGVAKVAECVDGLLVSYPNLRCVAFLGDNREAGEIIAAIGNKNKSNAAPNIRHCNLGLLPTSEGSWKAAVKATNCLRGAWLHIHENADMRQAEQRRTSIESEIKTAVHQIKSNDWVISCEHTEMVKTYAPGVGHFVFDIWIRPSTTSNQDAIAVS